MALGFAARGARRTMAGWDDMRLYQTERIRRLLRRLPRGGPLAWLEIVLIVALGVQLARLIWAIATPLGPYGDWRPREASVMAPAARAALFAHFDPFFRGAEQSRGTQAVTSLNLKLFGVRLNEASGLGSAIILTPDGQQSSFAVGDKVVEGVTLKAVAIDHVVLDKGGADESLFLDQSTPAPVANPSPAMSAPMMPLPGDVVTAEPSPPAQPLMQPASSATPPPPANSITPRP